MMNKKIYVINGYAGSGKDTFVEFVSYFGKTMNISSVDKVKEAAFILSTENQKDEKYRKFLSELKKLSDEYYNSSDNYIHKKVLEFIKSDNIFMFVHIREPENIEKFCRKYNAISILVKNENVKSITSNESDKNVENYNYDIIIDNSGSVIDLLDCAKKFALDNKPVIGSFCCGCS